MTSRERVLTAMGHEEPDRVPLFFNAIDAKLVRALGAGTLVETWKKLCVDVFVVVRRTWCGDLPSGLGYSPNPPPPEESRGGAGVAGWNGVDEFGRRWEHGRYVGGAVATRADLHRYSAPLRLEERYDRPVIEVWKRDNPDRAFALFSHTGPLGLTIECMGFVEFCNALYDDRGLVHESVERKTEWFIQSSRFAAEQFGLDFVVMGDDLGFKGHGYISPDDFRELGFPPYRRIVDALPVPVVWHSEGYVADYLPLAIEAGIRGIHGIEGTAGMELAEVKRQYGKDLVLLGNVDGNRILCQPDLALVRREVDRSLREGMEGGGFFLSIAGSAHEGVVPEALEEMCRHAREAGVYPPPSGGHPS